MQKITVLIADDHTIVRRGLRSLLQTEKDIEVIGEADTGRQAVQLAVALKPDVILMDIAMPMLNGLEATRQITGVAGSLPAIGPVIVGGVLVKKRTDLLTSREVEVLQLIAEGESNKQIAAELGISVKTVERHRQRLMDKLAIHDIAGLTRYAISKGLIEINVAAPKSMLPVS